jgi:hypothetical protein
MGQAFSLRDHLERTRHESLPRQVRARAAQAHVMRRVVQLLRVKGPGFNMAHMKVASMLIALLAITPLTIAFQNPEPLPLSDFAIEITNGRGQTFHLLLEKNGSKHRPSFTLNPAEIVKRADKDSDQVSEVYVTAFSDGNVWRIKVSVVKGEFYDKGEQDVAKYLVREGEKVTVKEMEQFGVRPFDVSVVRVNPAAASQPEVRNRTESIVVTKVEATLVPTPYRISLKNLSQKSVLALELNTYSGERSIALKWPQGWWEHPLIEPGGTHDEYLVSAGSGQATTYGYVPGQSTIIEVSTVVFTDGTYEGKPYLAAGTKAQTVGSKTQLRRVLQLLQSVQESTAELDENALTGLKKSVSLLSEELEPNQLKEVQDEFPTLDEGGRQNLGNFQRTGLHMVKADLLKEIETFEKTGQQQRSVLIKWVSKTQEKYERWLSALSQ